MSHPYDKTSADSIYKYSKQLTGKSLAECVLLEAIEENEANKGSLGTLVEKYFFNHTPPNTHEPDFPEAELELKTTGLVKKKNGLRAKERLVLTMINYNNIINEEWNSSTLWKKCKQMLILFYLYESEIPPMKRRFIRDPLLYVPSDEDIKILRKDWELIQEKVRDGKAHELSEGDTFYLGACRKGSGGVSENLRSTPGDAPSAKSRAFSLKPGFVNMLLERAETSLAERSLISITGEDSIEDALNKALEPFIGMTVTEIADRFHVSDKDRESKSFNYTIANRMLAQSDASIPELRKAEIELKTIRREASGKVRESMSFPGFKFTEIIHEPWEDSKFADKLEKKFLFLLYQKQFSDELAKKSGMTPGDNLRLVGAKFWNMPYKDRLEAMKVFEETKKRILINPYKLPSAKENSVAHVRPKATNKLDTYPLPQGGAHTKQCFWLNNTYIQSVVEDLFGGIEDLPFS